MTLNEAIYIMFTTKFKKDAREAFDMIEKAGYEVWKSNGEWEITNPKTSKYIYATRPYWNYKKGWVKILHYGDCATELNDKIDFVNCLNTPINTAKRRHKRYPNKFQEQRDNLRMVKRNIVWKENAIKDYEAKIIATQKNLMRAVEEKVKVEAELKELRKEYGLKERD